jgi:hypothetical protein
MFAEKLFTREKSREIKNELEQIESMILNNLSKESPRVYSDFLEFKRQTAEFRRANEEALEFENETLFDHHSGHNNSINQNSPFDAIKDCLSFAVYLKDMLAKYCNTKNEVESFG